MPCTLSSSFETQDGWIFWRKESWARSINLLFSMYSSYNQSQRRAFFTVTGPTQSRIHSTTLWPHDYCRGFDYRNVLDLHFQQKLYSFAIRFECPFVLALTQLISTLWNFQFPHDCNLPRMKRWRRRMAQPSQPLFDVHASLNQHWTEGLKIGL